MSGTRRNWTREETILAYELYSRTPFSKIEKNNKEIRDLANMIGRTPSSVGLKMANLASCDPVVKSKNLHGMSNCSKLDRKVFSEFEEDWGGLALLAQEIKAKYKGTSISVLNPDLELDDIPPGKYRDQQTKARVGQKFFRDAVLNAYGERCCITGLNNPTLLRASHIKPWKVSDEKKERTNPCNGLCLNPMHDVAFDKGFITLDKNYKVVISKELVSIDMDVNTKEWMMTYKGKEIIHPNKYAPDRRFIEYHNDVIFRG